MIRLHEVGDAVEAEGEVEDVDEATAREEEDIVAAEETADMAVDAGTADAVMGDVEEDMVDAVDLDEAVDSDRGEGDMITTTAIISKTCRTPTSIKEEGEEEIWEAMWSGT